MKFNYKVKLNGVYYPAGTEIVAENAEKPTEKPTEKPVEKPAEKAKSGRKPKKSEDKESE